MRKTSILTALLLIATTAAVQAQSDSAHEAPDARVVYVSSHEAAPPQLSLQLNGAPIVPISGALPRMAPELALQIVEKHAEWQSAALAGYSDTVDIEAQLPDSAQKGEYELIREYSAPNGLIFTPLKFTGDGFVKQNVITRLLQSEVDHVQKGESPQTALTSSNYKFSYKGTEKLDGRDVHVFSLKPRRKQPGLFKGKIYVDCYTGSLRRAEGTIAKSPSFFIKKIEFVQDYDDVDGFNFPIKMHSTAITRVVGRAIVNIFHRNYQTRAAVQPQALGAPAMSGSTSLQ